MSWLLRAPPCAGETDGAERATKRTRVVLPPQATQAEQTLRKYAECAALKLGTVANWSAFVCAERGHPDLAETVSLLPHKAARLLDHLRKRGASVPVRTAPWDASRLNLAAHRGSHQSAKLDAEFVCEEMLTFCEQGFWTVFPLRVALLLPHLRLSPLSMVPQRNRRPRLIVDYTFSNVNQDTIRLAPADAMQFGKALRRLLHKIVHADPFYGPVWLGKIDIADGFYRIGLQPRDIPRLGVILPTSSGEPLVALPFTLPMGWVESPPYFTSVTETACDLLNSTLRRWIPLAPHPLESLAGTPPPGLSASGGPAEGLAASRGSAAPGYASPRSTAAPRSPPLAYGDVYVDDFILAGQTKRHKQRVLRAALHSIDHHVLRPIAPADRPSRKAPVSVKKLSLGDACWATHKTVLGWDMDTRAETLNLPLHRLRRLYELLDKFPPTRRRAPISLWHQFLGELRSMEPALPGARGLFSTLQVALTSGDRHRVLLSRQAHDSLADFRAIADSLGRRPTRFRELIPVGSPVAIGPCDASQGGMGGVWFMAAGPPIVWRSEFLPAIQKALITSANRTGSVSISDLELAGTIAHKHVLADALPAVAERPIWLAGNNRASLAWATKGSSTSTSARAYLLRLNALHQRRYRYVAQHHYIAGASNVMADDASRRWDLTDSQLLAHFNSTYPQTNCCRLRHLSNAMTSAVTGSLL